MIEFCYTAACIDNRPDADVPYAVVGVFKGCVGYRLPDTMDLYFAKYEDANVKAHQMNAELGIDPKEAALLAVEAFRKTY